MISGKAIGQPSGWSEGRPDQQSQPEDVRCTVNDLRTGAPAPATELRPLRQALSDWAYRTPLRPEQVEALRLASYEAAANVIEHAYTTDRAGMPHADATCRLDRRIVTITVADHGRWRPATVNPRSTRGRGLLMIRALTDNTDLSTGPAGTTLHMTWAFAQHLTKPADT
jgi:serine/threonine-protein kinase RsbW